MFVSLLGTYISWLEIHVSWLGIYISCLETKALALRKHFYSTILQQFKYYVSEKYKLCFVLYALKRTKLEWIRQNHLND